MIDVTSIKIAGSAFQVAQETCTLLLILGLQPLLTFHHSITIRENKALPNVKNNAVS